MLLIGHNLADTAALKLVFPWRNGNEPDLASVVYRGCLLNGWYGVRPKRCSANHGRAGCLDRGDDHVVRFYAYHNEMGLRVAEIPVSEHTLAQDHLIYRFNRGGLGVEGVAGEGGLAGGGAHGVGAGAVGCQRF